MLLLARIDSGKGSLKKREVFLDEILMEIISRLNKKSPHSHRQIKIDFTNAELRQTTFCDPELMAHAFTNIIENALKYSSETSSVYVLVDWGPMSSRVIIQDEGPGISEQFKEQMFQRFSRDTRHSNTVHGYGLGLAISQRIAELHDTKLTASNRPAGGAEFQFEIKNF